MDIQTEKLSLIKWLTELSEPSVIKRLVAFKKEQEADWWDKISEEEKKEIEEGILQADSGELFSHEDVMSKYDKWRTK